MPSLLSGGHRRRVPVALAAVCLAVASCTGTDDPPDAATTSTLPPARTLLRVGVEQWPDCLNPLTCDDGVLAEQILRHVLPVAMEVDAAGGYSPSPLLAGEPVVEGGADDQAFTVTYRINSAARWNDGRPVTSSDFRATWLAVMATTGADQAGYREITAVDDADPAVAVVSLRQPLADWPQLFGGSRSWLLQGDALAGDLDLTGRFRDELPFSAGPFRLAAWDRDVAVLAADETYWDENSIPEIDQVRLERSEPDEDLGSFDVVVPAASGDVPDGFQAVAVRTTEVVGVWFDRRSSVLQPKSHRDALAVAFDRSELAALVGHEDDEVVGCLGWLPEVGPWCDMSDLPEGLFDPDLARFALAVEGWVAGDDGILARDGAPFSITVTHDPSLEGARQAADQLAEHLADLGLAVSVGEIDAETWRSSRPLDRSTGAGVFAFDVGVSPQVLDLYGCVGGEAASVVAWCPTEVTALAASLVGITDADVQLEVVEQIGDAAAADLVWIPLSVRPREMWARTQLVAIPTERAPGSGPLGRLHDFELTDR